MGQPYDVTSESTDRRHLHRVLRNPIARVVLSLLVVGPWYALGSDVSSARSAWLGLAVAIVAVALGCGLYYLVVPRWLEGRRAPAEFALGAAPTVGYGLLLGGLGFLAVLGTVALVGGVHVTPNLPLGRAFPSCLGMALVYGVLEELIFRGVLLRIVEQHLGSWLTLGLTGLAFGGAHLFRADATLYSAFAIALEAGVSLGAMYLATRSLWLPIGMHVAWDFTQSFLGTPQSGVAPVGRWVAVLSGPRWLTGGAFGIEESAVPIVLWGAVALVFAVVAVRRGRVIRPRWTRRG